MRKVILPLTVFFLLSCLPVLNSKLINYKKLSSQALIHDYVLPPVFTKFSSLDFKGIAADFQLLKAINFIGNKVQLNEKITERDWDYFIEMIHVVTKLDPKFYDPYYFSGALLAWGPGRFQDAIQILERGMENRNEDFHIPFVMAFIYFYFLQEHQKAAELLVIAAEKPGAPKVFFTRLSSRLAYYAGNTQFGINYINSMLTNETDPLIRQLYIKRKNALESTLLIEKAFFSFKTKFNKPPKNIKQLIDENFLDHIPEDPYGGEWKIHANGRVSSTSQFTDLNN